MEENGRLRFRERCKLAFAVLCGLICGISCLSVDLGHHIEAPPASGTLKQEGTIDAMTNGLGIVYYPRAYVSPPNLELTTGRDFWRASDYIEVIEQKPDQFRYRIVGAPPPSWIAFKWKADGIPVNLTPEPAVIKNVPGDTPPAATSAQPQPPPMAKSTPAEPPPPPTPIRD